MMFIILLSSRFTKSFRHSIILFSILSADIRSMSRSLPPSLCAPYSLDTETLALIESASNLEDTRKFLQRSFPSTNDHTIADAFFIHQVVTLVTTRSMTYFAIAIHALTTLLKESMVQLGLEKSDLDQISIGCDGSVINKYPQYMERTQDSLDVMTSIMKGRRIILVKTEDSAVLGAAVAASLAADEDT